MPFLPPHTILYISRFSGLADQYVRQRHRSIYYEFNQKGYKFFSLPDVFSQLSPELMSYLLPLTVYSRQTYASYGRILSQLNVSGNSGFLYRQGREVRFFPLLDTSDEEIEVAVNAFIASLPEVRETPREYRSVEPSTKPSKPRRRGLFASITGRVSDVAGNLFEENLPEAEAELSTEPEPLSIDTDDLPEEPLDPMIEKLRWLWGEIQREHHLTIEDLESLLGYTHTLSHLHITMAGKIYLTDLEGQPEVRMDDLTKALYFLYLRHPEGIKQKDVQNHEAEVLRIYGSLTGREDPLGIRDSVHRLVDPYGDAMNISLSRIKRAFKNIMDDRIARNYYVDGRAGQTRSIALNRDLVIWEH